MASISIQNVTKQFGGQIVLSDASVELNSGQTVGIVGPNGAGKTTLFRLILGRFPPDLGTVTCSKGLEVGYLPQEPEVNLASTLHDEVLSAFADILALERRIHDVSHEIAERHEGPEYEDLVKQYNRLEAQFVAADGYSIETRLKEIVGGLGFSEADYKLPMAALSGGQKCRVALAKLLLQDSSYLLLDEPTNHLDIDAVRWLEKFLAGHHGGTAIISHDRYLLDRLCDRIIEVDRGKFTSYSGNYTTYVKTRELRRLTQDRQYEKDKEFIEKERDYIARNIASKRVDVAKGRRTRLERRLAAGEFVTEHSRDNKTVRLGFDVEIEEGRTIFNAEQLAKRYDGKRLFENLSFTVGAGDRLGITGPNGTGKSTLLRVLLDQTAADAGRVETYPKATIGYYAQESRELKPENSILAEVLSVRPDFLEQQARSYLGRFLFTGEDVFKPVGRLSGGEQSRVRLIKLILQMPSVLVLDEPTNHLDIPSREALETALDEYPGTIVAVSHDRYFLDRVVDRLLILREGIYTKFHGNYTQWIENVERADSNPRSGPAATLEARTPKSAGNSVPGRTGQDPAQKSGRKNPQKLSRFEKMPYEELEAFIIAIEQRVSAAQERFGDPALARDRDALDSLQQEFDAMKAELSEAEAAWLRHT